MRPFTLEVTWRTTCVALLMTALSLSAVAAVAQEVLTEDCRLRVENVQYGRVEVSSDAGAHYLLIGRVLRAAQVPAAEKTASTPGIVLRGGKDGLAFSVAPGQTLKLRPNADPLLAPPGKKPAKPSKHPGLDPATIVTNLETGKGFFGDLLPPFRSAVRLQTGPNYLGSFSDSYAPTEEDVFVFLITLSPSTPADPNENEAKRAAQRKETLRQRFEAMANAYAEGAVARAVKERRLVVSGKLTLNAKLPAGEPDPIAGVNYAVDGKVIMAQNVPPWSHEWDTKDVADGEHVVEVTALSSKGDFVTRARALIVVRNEVASGASPALGAKQSP